VQRHLIAVVAAFGCLTLAGAPAATAEAARPHTPAIGIGEQDPRFFFDPRFTALGLRDARLVVSWDAMDIQWEVAQIDAWTSAARRAGVRPLVTFGHSRSEREALLPSPARFRRAFLAFRARYPQITDYQAFNEANHPSQPTYRRPDRAARYYDAMVRACRGCRVSAPAVLDSGNMASWLRRFEAAARKPVRIWSIHNYGDANYGGSVGTRRLLAVTRGQVWFTETGGIVERWVDGVRRPRFTPARAVRATRNVFRLGRLSRRIKRIYPYHWSAPAIQRPRWDSALIGRDGRPRGSYAVLEREVSRARAGTWPAASIRQRRRASRAVVAQ
jgi:hypothetical protein